MSKTSSSSSSGIGFAGALTIAFIVLKLTNVIDWSWWWVLSPSLISIGIVLVILAGLGVWWLFWIRPQEKRLDRELEELRKNKPTESRFMTKLHEAMAQGKANREKN